MRTDIFDGARDGDAGNSLPGPYLVHRIGTHDGQGRVRDRRADCWKYIAADVRDTRNVWGMGHVSSDDETIRCAVTARGPLRVYRHRVMHPGYLVRMSVTRRQVLLVAPARRDHTINPV